VPADITGKLSPMIVGPNFAVRKYVVGTTGFVANYNESTGIATTPIPGLGGTEVQDTGFTKVYLVNALVRFYNEAVVTPTSAQGTQYLTSLNKIRHNVGATVWTGSGYTVGLNAPLAVGDYIKVYNGANILQTKVAGFESTTLGGPPNVLVLEDNLPAALQGAGTVFFNVVVAQIVPEILLSSSYTLTATTIAYGSGITAATSRTGSAYPVVTGQSVSGSTYTAGYISYRALQTGALNDTPSSVTTIAQVASLFPNYTDPDSGLGFAVARAIQPVIIPSPTINSSVKCLSIATNDLAGYTYALNRLARRNDYGVLACLTSDEQVNELIATTVDNRNSSTVGLYTQAFIAQDLTTESPITQGANTVDINGTSVIRNSGVAAPFAGVVAGDIFRHYTSPTVYTAYTIQTVLSGQSITLASPVPGGPLTGEDFEVWHALTIAEQATDWSNRAAQYADGSISVVFPTEAIWNTTIVPGYYLAAVAAGLRGYTIPQQGIRGVQLEAGWTSVPQAQYDFGNYLETIATSGAVVFADRNDSTGVIILYANTTDQSETITAREALVANVNAVKRYIFQTSNCYTGKYKITDDVLRKLTNQIDQAGNYLLTQTNVSGFGPMVVTISVGTITRDPVLQDKILIPITATISATLEQQEITFTVTISE
jgi:hypothetical protein